MSPIRQDFLDYTEHQYRSETLFNIVWKWTYGEVKVPAGMTPKDVEAVASTPRFRRPTAVVRRLGGRI